jgi:hypothetical protein
VNVTRVLTAAVSVIAALSPALSTALEVGEAGSFQELSSKLATEKQTLLLVAASGTREEVLGVRFYLNSSATTAYVLKTDSVSAPYQMKVLLKLTSAKLGDPRATTVDPAFAFIDSKPAIIKCDMLVNAKLAQPGECNSLNVNLETVKGDGKFAFLQGSVGVNLWTVVVNLSTGRGNVFESSSEGATFIRLAFVAAKWHGR